MAPEVEVARREESEADQEKFTLAILKLSKYLREVETPMAGEIIFDEAAQYKLFKDHSI